MVRHLLHRIRCAPCRGSDPDVVERHDATRRSQFVDQRRVPIVEVPAEVLEQEEWDSALTHLAIGVLDAVRGPDDLVRNVRICRCHSVGCFQDWTLLHVARSFFTGSFVSVWVLD